MHSIFFKTHQEMVDITLDLCFYVNTLSAVSGKQLAGQHNSSLKQKLLPAHPQ